jgi:hypothetical protein
MSFDWRAWIAVLLLLLGATVIYYVNENSHGDGQCTASDNSSFGLLDVEPVRQYKEVWCWAASANVVTNFYALRDPISTSTPQELYSQCRLYNIGNVQNPGFDCCPDAIRSDNRCLQTGWPHEVFNRLTPVVTHAPPPNGYILWNEVKQEICPNGKPGRPFIYAAHPENGIPHTYIVKGFDEEISSQTYVLLVDSHVMLGTSNDANPEYVGASPVDYDCYQTGWCAGGIYTHDRTYYSIRPIDNASPAPPSGLDVK